MGSGHGRDGHGLGATALQWDRQGSVKGCDGCVTGLKEARRYRLGIAFSACAARQWMDVSQKRWVGMGARGDKAE